MTQLNIPYNFQNQTTSDANQVDQNFNAVANVVNGKLADDNMTPNSLTSASVATEGIVATDTKNLVYAQDLFSSSFIISGGACTKDGTNANQVDVTSPILGWVKQNDNTFRRLSVAVTNYKTTIANTTYYLDLGSDGTVYWAQTHPSVNYATIATVTSDASSNVNVITDTRNIVHTFVADFLRTDSNAPNPQTVANPVNFSGLVQGTNGLGATATGVSKSQGANNAGIYFGWNNSAGQGEADIFCYGQGGTGGLSVWNTNSASYPTFTKILNVDSSGNATFPGNITSNGINGTAQAQINYSGSPGNLVASTTTTFTVVTGLPTSAKSFALAWQGIGSSTTKGQGLINGNQSNESASNASNVSNPPWTITGASLSNGSLSITINNSEAITYSSGTWTLNVWGMIM